uniref:Uncharacterized protein n=1 Tax=Ananas comosus var. bracteatus TaxID=296719 RepID=A0A6V7QE86_ANACO|nr:unnamed protein product [Ananas comosus var. bracteatus]
MSRPELKVSQHGGACQVATSSVKPHGQSEPCRPKRVDLDNILLDRSNEAILLGFGCYFLGKAKGREEMYAEVRSQVYSTPVPPSAAMVSTPPAHYQKEGFNNV